MAVTFGTAGSAADSSAGRTAALTASVTIASGQALAVVVVGNRAGGGAPCVGTGMTATFNSDALTEAVFNQWQTGINANGPDCGVFYLTAPDVGTFTLSITPLNASNSFFIAGFPVSGWDTSDFLGSIANLSDVGGTADNINVSGTGVAAGNLWLHVGAIRGGDVAAFTPTGSTAELFDAVTDADAAQDIRYFVGSLTTTGGVDSVGASSTTTDRPSAAMIEIKAAAGGGGRGGLKLAGRGGMGGLSLAGGMAG